MARESTGAHVQLLVSDLRAELVVAKDHVRAARQPPPLAFGRRRAHTDPEPDIGSSVGIHPPAARVDGRGWQSRAHARANGAQLARASRSGTSFRPASRRLARGRGGAAPARSGRAPGKAARDRERSAAGQGYRWPAAAAVGAPGRRSPLPAPLQAAGPRPVRPPARVAAPRRRRSTPVARPAAAGSRRAGADRCRARRRVAIRAAR